MNSIDFIHIICIDIYMYNILDYIFLGWMDTLVVQMLVLFFG